jgi:hypothetical protein
MNTKLTTIAAAVSLAVVAGGLTAAPAGAHGCPSTFWKKQSKAYAKSPSWLYVKHPATRTTARARFKLTKNPRLGVFRGFARPVARLRMQDALSLRGGQGLLGAHRLLARAAAAAYLNITVVHIYPVRFIRLKSIVKNALASKDRATIASWARELAAWNNLKTPGYC